MKTPFLSWHNETDIEKIIFLLKSDSVVVGPSDTVIGLLARTTKSGSDTLNQIKHRSGKSYITLIKSKDLLNSYIQMPLPIQIENIIAKFWPGPLTIVFKAKKDLPDYLIGENNTISLRVPDHEGLQKLLSVFDGIFSTSANLSGNPVPKLIAELDPFIQNQVAGIIDDEGKNQGLPSTIIDCSGDQIKLLREGAIPWQEIEKLSIRPS